jgi:RNA polymerase-binding transcription factor DksA
MLASQRREILRKTLEHRAALARGGAPGGPSSGEVRKALIRLAGSSFGFCECCHLTIPWRDLMEKPERTTCSRCEAVRPAPRPSDRMRSRRTRSTLASRSPPAA